MSTNGIISSAITHAYSPIGIALEGPRELLEVASLKVFSDISKGDGGGTIDGVMVGVQYIVDFIARTFFNSFSNRVLEGKASGFTWLNGLVSEVGLRQSDVG